MKKVVFSLLFLVLRAVTSAQDTYTQQNAERLYKAGVQLVERKEFAAARITFEEFLSVSTKADNRTIEAEYYKAYCALNLYHQDGEKLVDDFIESHPNNPRAASVYLDLANFFYAEKNYGKATEYFSKVDFNTISSGQTNMGRFKWGYSLFNLKKLPEALDQFNFIKNQGGQYGSASSYYAGFIEFGQTSYENALTDLKRAEENESYASIVPYLIASVYYKQRKYDELLTYINSIKSKSGVSNTEDIVLLSAEGYFKKADYKNSYDSYKKYLEGKATLDKGVLARAGYSALSTGKDDEALSYFKNAASNKDSVGFYSSYYLGFIYLKKKQQPLAFLAFDNARKFLLDKRIAEESLYQYSKLAFDLDRGDSALDGFESFLKLYPESDHVNEVKELLSQAYVTTNNYDKAISYIESLDRHGEALDKAYQKACFLKGSEFFNKEDYTQAQQYFKKSLQNPIDNNYKAEASYWSGEIYSLEKNDEMAIEQYQNVLATPKFSNQEITLKARYGLGYSQFNLQQFDKALYHFREYVNKAPNQNQNLADATLRLADCYYVTKAYAEALLNYKKSINLKGSDADYAYLQSGNIYSIQGNYKEAAENFDVFLKKFPQSRFIDEGMFQRAQLDFEQGNYAVAVIGFTKLIESGKPSRFLPYAYVRRASSYYNLKAFDKTAADYISVLELFPGHPVADETLLPLQEALTNAGKASEFDKYLADFKNKNPNAKGLEAVEFEAAKGLYFNQSYDKAIVSLTNYIVAYPESVRTSEANYYRAESYYRLKDYSKAIEIYKQISSVRGFSFANKVTARIAELEFRTGNYDKAIAAFWVLNKAASTKKELFNAWSGLMESHFLLAQYDSVKVYAHLILEKAKVNAGAENKASLFLGKAALGKGDNEEAKDEFLNTLNNAQDEYGAEAKYLLGELQFNDKEYKQCYETLISLNKDFSSYTPWVGKSYLLLADYFVAVNDRYNATATLQVLVENFPLQLVKDTARAKLRKLEDDSKNQVQDTVTNKKN